MRIGDVVSLRGEEVRVTGIESIELRRWRSAEAGDVTGRWRATIAISKKGNRK